LPDPGDNDRSRSLLKAIPEPLQDLLGRLLLRELGGPRATWMKSVPSWALHGASSRAWVVVAESIYDYIPNRLVVLHKEALCQRDPNRHNDKIATHEIAEFEVLGLLDTLAVLIEPPEEIPAC